MDKELDQLKNRWKKDKEQVDERYSSVEQIVASAKAKKKKNIYHYYGNIAVLTFTLIVLILFFYFIAPFEEGLSHLGIVLMLGGLSIRILVELLSIFELKAIDFHDHVLKTTRDTEKFYQLRKKVNGPLTIIILLAYSIGFYLLTPEFLRYLEKWQVILIDVSYVFIIGAIGWNIYNIVKKETSDLQDILNLKADLLEGE